MNIQPGAIKKALERDGYAVVKDVFSAEEIAGMRGELRDLLAKKSEPLNGGLCSGPVPRDSGLARLLHDPRLASPWSGELPCQMHAHVDTYNGWHVDFESPTRKTPMRISGISPASTWIYKIAIFLQDHSDRDGLSVIPGSHEEGSTPRTPLHVCTRAGDIIIFNHRIWHAGRLPTGSERLIETFASWLNGLHLVDYTGRQRLQRRFRMLQHLIRSAPTRDRLAIFLFFETHYEIGRRYWASSRDS